MRRVTLSRRKGQTYGFHLSGGTEHGTGFFITKVEDGSIAQKEGIKAGDELLEVEGRGVGGATHRQVTQAIGASAAVALLLRGAGAALTGPRDGDSLIWRPMARSPTGASQVSAPRGNLKTVPPNGPVPNGSAVNSAAYTGGCVSNGPLPNGAVKALPGRKLFKNGNTHVDSNLHVSNGTSHVSSGASHMSNGTSHVSSGTSHVSSSHVSSGSSQVSSGALHVSSGASHVSSGASHVSSGASHVSIGASHVSNGAPHALKGSLPRSDSSVLGPKTAHGSAVQFLNSKSRSTSNGALGPMGTRGMSPGAGGLQHTQVSHRPRPTGDLEERLLRVVVSVAGKSSLGFSITHDKGVATVATVRRGGAAWAAGLRQHDRIMACNGRAIASMTHEQAVAEMKKSQATITLEVRRIIKVEQITGESSGYNSSASSTTGDQASPTTTTTPRRRRPNVRLTRDPLTSRLAQGRLRARQLELQRIEGHWAAAEAEEAEERRRRVGHHRGVSRSHSASDLLDTDLYCVHPPGGAMSASVSSLTAVGADSSADDHDSSGCEDKGALLTPSAGAHVSNIVVSSSSTVSCDEDDAICRLERLEGSGGDEPQLQLVELQLQRIRQHQLQLARQERQLLTEKTIYAERRQLQLDRSSPRPLASAHSPSDSDTLYSHGPLSSASSSGSPPASNCGKHTSRILIKSCPPPPPLRQENTPESPRDCLNLCSLDPSHLGAASCDCCKSRDCSRHCCCRASSSRNSRNSPPSSPSSSSGVSCSSHTLHSSSSVTRSKSFDTLSSTHLEEGRHLPHFDCAVNDSKSCRHCISCHRPVHTVHDCAHDKTYCSSSSIHDRTYSSCASVHDKTHASPASVYDRSQSSGQPLRSKIPAPPLPNGLPIIPRPPPLRMGDDSSSTASSSSSSSSGPSNAPDTHRTNFAAALSDVVSKRNARLTEDDDLDEGDRAEAYEAKIDAYKREKQPPADSKKLQHDLLMEEFKRKHQKMFDGEEHSRPLTPVTSTTTTEVRYFGSNTTTTRPQSTIVSAATGSQSTIVSAATGPQSTIVRAETGPQSTIVSAAVRSQNTFSSTTTRPQSTVSATAARFQTASAVRPQSTIIIGTNAASESSSTLPSSVKKTSPLRQQVKAVEIIEKGDPFASKILTRSSSSSVATFPDTERKVTTTLLRQKNLRGDSDAGANDEDDSSSARHFWKKKENASNAPASKPKGKAPVQATKSFSGLRTIDKASSSSSAETNGVFPVVLKKTTVEPTIPEDVNDDTESPSASQLIKTFESSSAPKKTGPTTRPKSVVLVTNTSPAKVTGAPDASKSITMKPVSSIDRTPRLVSQQVPSKYTIIPPPPSPPSDKLIKQPGSNHCHQISSHAQSLPQSISSNTSKVYVSVNGDNIESCTYLSNNIINGISSDTDQHFPELMFSEAYQASPLSSSTNLNFSIRNVSPTELIIPAPPSSSAELNPEIPRGVPPPPPACGDSWSERYERRLFADDDLVAPPPAAEGRQVSSDFKNLFSQPDPAQSKPLVAINAYRQS